MRIVVQRMRPAEPSENDTVVNIRIALLMIFNENIYFSRVFVLKFIKFSMRYHSICIKELDTQITAL